MASRLQEPARQDGLPHGQAAFRFGTEHVFGSYSSRWVAVCFGGDICAWQVPSIRVLLPFTRPRSLRSAVHRFSTPELCSSCGLPVLDKCSSCRTSILARKLGDQWQVGRFCWNCGHPYPWRNSQQQLASLEEALLSGRFGVAVRQTIVERIAALKNPGNDATRQNRARLGEQIKRLSTWFWREAAQPALQKVLAEVFRRLLWVP